MATKQTKKKENYFSGAEVEVILIHVWKNKNIISECGIRVIEKRNYRDDFSIQHSINEVK